MRRVDRDVVLDQRANPFVSRPRYGTQSAPEHSVVHDHEIHTLFVCFRYRSTREVDTRGDFRYSAAVLKLQPIHRIGIIRYRCGLENVIEVAGDLARRRHLRAALRIESGRKFSPNFPSIMSLVTESTDVCTVAGIDAAVRVFGTKVTTLSFSPSEKTRPVNALSCTARAISRNA